MGKGRREAARVVEPFHRPLEELEVQDEPVRHRLCCQDLVGRMVRIDEAEAMGIPPQVGPREDFEEIQLQSVRLQVVDFVERPGEGRRSLLGRAGDEIEGSGERWSPGEA